MVRSGLGDLPGPRGVLRALLPRECGKQRVEWGRSAKHGPLLLGRVVLAVEGPHAGLRREFAG